MLYQHSASVAAAVLAGLLAGDRAMAQCDPQEDAKLTPADFAPDDYFGDAVGISGDATIIGSPYKDNCIGAAYIFRRDGTSWVEEQKLTASDGDEQRAFGCAVVMGSDMAIVGAHWDDDNGSVSGAAYVYGYDGAKWVEEQKLTASDGEAFSHFGNSASMSGDVVAIGAIGYQNDTGAAYIFRSDGASWSEEAKLVASDGAAHDWFANCLSVSGDAAVVGAPYDDDNGVDSGSAYVFRYDGAKWVEEEKLTASDGTPDDEFGWSVSISGDVVLVGAEGEDRYSGSVYVFRYDGGKWVETQKLRAFDSQPGDFFGASVVISNHVAVVGSVFDDDNGAESGSAYIFRDDGVMFVDDAKLITTDGSPSDWFGNAVSMSADVVVIGASNDQDNGEDAGSAYVFDLNCPSDCPEDLDGSGAVDFGDILRILTAWGNPGGPEDLDESGAVDFGDILVVLTAWGPCP